MLPLIPLAITLLPEIGKWLFGSSGESVAKDASAVVSAIAGTDDATAAAAAISADPAKAMELRARLAEIAAKADADARAADLATLTAKLGDVANARNQTEQLASSGSRIAWGAPILSGIILLAFGVMLSIVLFRDIPQSSQAIANVLLGTLATMAVQVANYWLGSSAGSAAKTRSLDDARHQAQQSVSADVVGRLIAPATAAVVGAVSSAADDVSDPMAEARP